MSRVALYRQFCGEELAYVGVSANPIARMANHKNTSPWFDGITRIELEWFDDRDDALRAERLAIGNEGPQFNGTKRMPRKVVARSKFGKWLRSSPLTQQEVAALLGVQQPQISKMALGASQPSFASAVAIEMMTDGQVPVASWPAFARPVSETDAA